MADKAQALSRPMKYPYTYTAKVVQFPWKFYFTKSKVYQYYLFGIIASMPIFYKIQKLSNSPENKALWAEKRRQEAAERHH
ncbi:hypothetical protein FQA39_LY08315 [Lamprigera yunnana]|nr:hypothetical protein FQA39_LY08315 [Lamprigera yunnana]